MVNRSHCFEILLDEKVPSELPDVVVAFGDDAFLRKETFHQLLKLAKIDQQDARVFDGEDSLWRDIHDELATMSLFDPTARRVAVVKNGDELVKKSRAPMEKWFGSPAPGSLLLLELSSFPANTKLYKIAAEKGWCIECAAPAGRGRDGAVDSKAVQRWIVAWANHMHALQLTSKQAEGFLDLVGSDFGLMHQELAKLALFADEKGKVSDELLRKTVGGWRMQTIWKVAEAVASGHIAIALQELHKVFASGEHPAAVLPQLSWSLRRYSVATHLFEQAERNGTIITLGQALSQAGFRAHELQQAEKDLKRMGRHRAGKILELLLELDLKLKGSHSHESRSVFSIEDFVARLG